jgi:hypothetical protein
MMLVMMAAMLAFMLVMPSHTGSRAPHDAAVQTEHLQREAAKAGEAPALPADHVDRNAIDL